MYWGGRRGVHPPPSHTDLPRAVRRGSKQFYFFWIKPLAIALAHFSSPKWTEKEHVLSAMWKPNQTGPINSTPTPEPPRAVPPPAPVEQPTRAQAITGEQAVIGKGLFIKGEITGSESLLIDGKVEGSLNLPGNRVTVGRNGQVAANITAREIVVLGKVKGNVTASDRVDIRAEGSLSGDVAAARISIEDGAFFKGGIDIRKPDSKPTAVPEPAKAVNA
jgi:cytoskeletal protein CcmA (bactofilin family)